MNTHIFNRYIYSEHICRSLKCGVVYFLGLVAGCLLAYGLSDFVAEGFGLSIFAKPSFPGLLFTSIFPAAILIIILHFSWDFVLYILLFVHSFFRGVVGILISFSLENAAWLVRPLAMFSGAFISVILLMLAIQKRCIIQFKDGYFLLLILAIPIFDYFVISQFLLKLLVYF